MMIVFILLLLLGLGLTAYAFRNIGDGNMEKKDVKFVYEVLTLVTIVLANMILFATNGIDFITIMWGICLSITIPLISWSIYYYMYIFHKDRYADDLFPIIMTTLVCLCLIISPAIITLGTYNDAFELSYKYNAICDTIDETQEMLLKYENNPDLAHGLEALELKQTLSNAIEKRNNLKAEIDIWLAHPITPFKNVVRAGMS